MGFALSAGASFGRALIPSHPSYQTGTGPLTIEFWTRASNTLSPLVLYHGTDTWNVHVNRMDIGTIYVFSFDHIDGDWHHVAFVREGLAVRMYVDGIQVDSRTLKSNLSVDAANPLQVWGPWGGNSDLTELRFWGVARTQEEILYHKAQRLTGTEPGLLGLWPMDEGSGTTIHDLTPTANDGTFDATYPPIWISDGPDLHATERFVPVADLELEAVSPTWGPRVYEAPTAAFDLEFLPVMDVRVVPLSIWGLEAPPAGMEARAAIPGAIDHIEAPPPGVETRAAIPGSILHMEALAPLPVSGSVYWVPLSDFAWSALPGLWARQASRGQPIYRVTLTGAPDGLEDVVLPCSSLQARRRSGEPSYVQVTVADPLTWAQAIAARPNGEIIVERGLRLPDGQELLAEIARANLETIDDARGGRSATVTLTGHKQQTTEVPTRRELTQVSYYRSGTGPRRARAAMDYYLRPGDTAVFPEQGEEWTVGLISYTVDARTETMEVVEAV